MQIISTLIKDEQDLVRLYLVDALVAFFNKDTDKVNRLFLFTHEQLTPN
jgi:hypothetical protein